jgi:CBS domain-containing protein
MMAAVKDVMTTRVIWAKKDTTFRELAAALREHRISAFPVLDEQGRVIGVVSEADMLAKEALDGGYDEPPGMVTGLLRREQLQKARGITASDLMTAPPVTVSAQATVEHAARLMYLHRVKRLPVINADRQLVGIIGRADVLSVFDRTDKAIRQDVTADMTRHGLLTGQETIKVAVRDGVVTLTGVARPGAARHETMRRIRRIQGVVAVRDQLSYLPSAPEDFDVLASFPAD